MNTLVGLSEESIFIKENTHTNMHMHTCAHTQMNTDTVLYSANIQVISERFNYFKKTKVQLYQFCLACFLYVVDHLQDV